MPISMYYASFCIPGLRGILLHKGASTRSLFMGVSPVSTNLSVFLPEEIPKKSASLMCFSEGIFMVKCFSFHNIVIRISIFSQRYIDTFWFRTTYPTPGHSHHVRFSFPIICATIQTGVGNARAFTPNDFFH